MKTRRYKRYLVQSLSFLSISLICLVSFMVIDYSSNKDSLDESEALYVSYEILTDNTISVNKEEDNLLIRPYTSDEVTIGKNFYDYKSEEKDQQNSIIFYEGTYIQNSGVDYVSKDVFNVCAILDGKVISITTDDIVGTTIKIEHKDGMISTYQSLSETLVKENDNVVKGQTIGKSGTNAYASDLGNHLHFELFYKNRLVNPEEYYNKPVGEL